MPEVPATFPTRMLKFFERQQHSADAESATDLIVATPDWRDAVSTVTVIDIAEFEAAHDDSEWLAFCERTDEYLELVQPDLSR